MEGLDGAQGGGRPGKNGSPRLNLPQARAYKHFKIGELYYKVKLRKAKIDKRSATAHEQNSVYSLPLVNAKYGDNGIMFYGKPDCFESAEMTIDIIQNGAIATGKVYPQPQRTGVLWDAYLIKARNHVDTERSLIFISCAIEKVIKERYDRDNKATWERVSTESITLPVREDGAIDFAYMEAYIRELETERVREMETIRNRMLGSYLGAAGFDDYKLTEAEWQAVDDWKNGNVPSKVFKAGDLFEVRSNPQLNKESFVFTESAEYPYFTRTVFNNGILGYVNYLDDEHKIDGGSLAVGMLGMQFFYMQHDFYAGQFTKTVFPKFKGFDEPVALFFASLFNKGRNQFLKGLVRDFQRLFLGYEVNVPVDKDGNIDLPFVRSFIRGTMKLAIGGVMAWKDKEIAATKTVIRSQQGAMTLRESNVNSKRHYTEADEEQINNYLHSDSATPEGYLALLDKFKQETDVSFFDGTLIAANVAFLKDKQRGKK